MSKPILIVDDEEDIREVLKDAFELEGYEVVLAEDGEQALVVLERIDPCMVLLDIIMPRLDGVAVYEKMRAHERWSKIPVIFSTSDPSRAPAGVLILRKPVDLDVLIATVAKTRSA